MVATMEKTSANQDRNTTGPVRMPVGHLYHTIAKTGIYLNDGPAGSGCAEPGERGRWRRVIPVRG